MAGRIPRVTKLVVVDHFRLQLTFDDGLVGDVDLSDLKDAGPVFEGLRDSDFFERAYIDPATQTVTWPGGIDLDPERLHDEASGQAPKAERPNRHSLLASVHRSNRS